MNENIYNHRIAVICWCTSPVRGSEFAVSWNYIQQMSKSNKLYVFYGTSGGGIGNISEVADWVHKNKHDNIEFIDVQLPKTLFTDILDRWRKYSYVYPFYFQYKLWHQRVKIIVEDYCDRGLVDVVHYLNPIGFKEPGQIRKIQAPYIWGPVQTVQNRPLKLWKAIRIGGVKAVIDCLVRLVVHNSVLLFSPSVRGGVMNSDVLFSATPLSQRHFRKLFKKDSIYLPENGILKMERSEPLQWDGNGQLELIWVGEISYRKALCIMLDSLALLSDEDQAKVHLNVVGNGALKEKMKKFVDEKKLPVTFYGSLSRAEVQKIFMKSHLHVITSIGDATTTVLWEAMSKAIPTLTLDHCGMAGVVCQRCGIKIPIYNYKKTVDSISSSVHAIIHTPDIIRRLSDGCLMCAKDFMWDKRIEIFNKAYDDAIMHYQTNKP